MQKLYKNTKLAKASGIRGLGISKFPLLDEFDGAIDPTWTGSALTNGFTTLTQTGGYLNWVQTTAAVVDPITYLAKNIGNQTNFIVELNITNMAENTLSPYNKNFTGLIFFNSANGKALLWGLNHAFASQYLCLLGRFNGIGPGLTPAYVSTPIQTASLYSTIPSNFFYKVALSNNTLTFYTSADGVTWTLRGTELLSAHILACNSIGLWQQNNNINTIMTTRSQYFRLTPL
jgi:hypothetical protein